jgi:hypothetical protein
MTFVAKLLIHFVVAVGASMTVIAQEGASPAEAPLPPRISNIRDTSVVDGCGCYFQLPAEWKNKQSDKYVFMEGIDGEGAWMNIGGKDVKLKLVGSSNESDWKVGARSFKRYEAQGIAVRIDYVVTRVCRPGDEQCESTDYDATFTVTKAGRRRAIKAKGVCGC